MEIDYLKSTTTEDKMEMMLMNMDDVVVSSNPSDHEDFTNTSALPPHFMEDPPSFMNLSNNTISFSNCGGGNESTNKKNSMAAMRETIFRVAAMQPVNIDPESVKPPKRRNVKMSTDPQSVAARHRRERISERIRILQRLVPGGTKMDTASMLDEAIHYVKFLKNQLQYLERASVNRVNNSREGIEIKFPVAMCNGSHVNSLGNNKQVHHHQQDNTHQGLQRYGAI